MYVNMKLCRYMGRVLTRVISYIHPLMPKFLFAHCFLLLFLNLPRTKSALMIFDKNLTKLKVCRNAINLNALIRV